MVPLNCLCLYDCVCVCTLSLFTQATEQQDSVFSPQMLTCVCFSTHKHRPVNRHTKFSSFHWPKSLFYFSSTFSPSHFYVSFCTLPLFIISLGWSFFLAQKGCHGDRSRFDTERRNELYSHRKPYVCVLVCVCLCLRVHRSSQKEFFFLGFLIFYDS